jgi:hypothetical protein
VDYSQMFTTKAYRGTPQPKGIMISRDGFSLEEASVSSPVRKGGDFEATKTIRAPKERHSCAGPSDLNPNLIYLP